jgi:hypothetical protein
VLVGLVGVRGAIYWEWLAAAVAFFQEAGHAHVERACRSLLWRAGAP